MEWVEFCIRLPREAVEAAAAVFWDVGATGVAVEDPGGGPPPGRWDLWEPPPTGPAAVRAWFPAAGREELGARIEERLAAVRRVFGAARCTQRTCDDAVWIAAWWAALRARRVGPFRLLPEGSAADDRGKGQPLHLVRGQAFGTGDHPTTAMCLEALSRRVEPGRRVLDVGTGSGILAVAAALLGAVEVTAWDVDPEAVRLARANARRNRVAMRVRREDFRSAELPAADLVVANLTPSLVTELAPRARRALGQGGFLVVSGLGVGHLAAVGRALEEAGFVPLRSRRRGGWGLWEAVAR
ncbi:MAG: 50S ribosomal protein L11 methyltransferase [Thermaerobacter sp.]|nr:50S ribosomal protein L11 methyltransferase [Thermaerobacter sp.]